MKSDRVWVFSAIPKWVCVYLIHCWVLLVKSVCLCVYVHVCICNNMSTCVSTLMCFLFCGYACIWVCENMLMGVSICMWFWLHVSACVSLTEIVGLCKYENIPQCFSGLRMCVFSYMGICVCVYACLWFCACLFPWASVFLLDFVVLCLCLWPY